KAKLDHNTKYPLSLISRNINLYHKKLCVASKIERWAPLATVTIESYRLVHVLLDSSKLSPCAPLLNSNSLLQTNLSIYLSVTQAIFKFSTLNDDVYHELQKGYG
ncbi:hypothetical protein O6P43_026466, partial [Quillaja saponaria]